MKYLLAVSIILHHSFVKYLYSENILSLCEFCTVEQHKNTVTKYNVCAALSTDNVKQRHASHMHTKGCLHHRNRLHL
jgi:hypothetical protein